MNNALRQIPPVHELLARCAEEDWAKEYSREQLLKIIREELKEFRELSKQGDLADAALFISRIAERAERNTRFSLKRVINATGVIVHTNLGRAPIADNALQHLSHIARGYSNLEFDLKEGERGSRDQHLDHWLRLILPVRSSLVVNNNAAALLLVLNSLAEGKEVLVSRGELVEIGGSFRLPDVMQKSGAILREVGTTNKTRKQDYKKAITDQTGMILIVHPSNYQIIGFVERPSVEDLVEIGRQRNIPVVEDQGSGIFTDMNLAGIPDEPQVSERLSAGLDLITFSGDKILGGPQAGIVCGKKIWVEKCRNNPMFRALRVDKLIYAALEATLMAYAKGTVETVPVLRMIRQSPEQLRIVAENWLAALRSEFTNEEWSIEATSNFIGGGVAPMKELPSCAIVLASSKPAHEVAARLRQGSQPVVARVENDRVYFEVRTLLPGEEQQIMEALRTVLAS